MSDNTFMGNLMKDVEELNRRPSGRGLLPRRQWDTLTEEEKFYDSLGQLQEAREKGLIKARSDGPALTGRLVDIVNGSLVGKAMRAAGIETKAAPAEPGSLLDIVTGRKHTKDLVGGEA